MERTDINPWEWSKVFGFSQAVELTGVDRILVCSGQTAMGPDGSPPTRPIWANKCVPLWRTLDKSLKHLA